MTQDLVSQEPDTAMPGRWRMPALAVVSLVAGIAAGVTFARTTVGDAYPGDGGVVYVCHGQALALVHASGLQNLEVEVQFPIRGDGSLLPLPADGVEVLAGRATGYQVYRPVDGKLAIARDVSPPLGDTVVGSRRHSAGHGPRPAVRHSVAVNGDVALSAATAEKPRNVGGPPLAGG